MEVVDGIHEVRLGVYMTTGKEVINKHNSGNRRIRNRTYGGVRGRREQSRLLLDLTTDYTDCTDFFIH